MGKTDKDKAIRKRLYFRILSLLLVLLFFMLIELFLRAFSVGTDMHLFIKSESGAKENYMKINPNVGEKYFTRFEATSGTNDMFLKEKPENGYRVFLLGSSTIYGYPYGSNLMASRILHRRLQDAYPDRTIEVVNTSITAINSITLKDFANQVFKYDPDALLIYAGHNEYYGAFGAGSNETMSRSSFLMWTHLKLINLRIYQLMRSAIGGIAKGFANDPQDSEARGTLMKRIVKDENIVYHGEKYQLGLEQYRQNMSHILRKARAQDIPVYISDLVSNIKDMPPFGDVKESDMSALRSYEEALELLAKGDTVEARRLFYRAKDLDPIRFRASEEINEIIYELTREYQARLIPAKEWFSKESPGGLIGSKLITEHVHPNIEGQFVLADAFYAGIVNSDETEAPAVQGNPPAKAYYRYNWSYTDLDSLIGAYKVDHLKSSWPFSELGKENAFRDTFQVSGLLDSLAFSMLTNPKASFQSLHYQLAEYYEQEGELYMAMKEYEALISINPYRSNYYTMAGTCMLKLNDLFASEKYLRESMNFGQDLYAYSLLGEIETIKHNYKEAVDLFSAALEMADTDQFDNEEAKVLTQELKRKLSNVEALSGNPLPTSNSEYPKYIPRNIEQTYNRARALSSTESDSALIYFMRCLEINDCPLVNYRIGNILYQQQDLSVLSFYDKAYSGYFMDPDFLVRYCVACLYNQNLPKAKETYVFLSEIAPQHSDLPSLRQALER